MEKMEETPVSSAMPCAASLFWDGVSSMFLPCRYGRKSTANHEFFQRVPALCGVSSISSMHSAIQIYQPSILKKHIETDINYIIIYMFYGITAFTFLDSTTYGENGGNSLFVRESLIFLTFLDGVSSMSAWKKPHETGRKSRQRKRRTARAIRQFHSIIYFGGSHSV